jgi:DNA-binding XRE family transcriptional regulator
MVRGLRSRDHRAFRAVVVGARLEQFMTQEQLAEKLGWERSVISKIETGERTCSVWEFMAICRALGEKPSKMMARMENW